MTEAPPGAKSFRIYLADWASPRGYNPFQTRTPRRTFSPSPSFLGGLLCFLLLSTSAAGTTNWRLKQELPRGAPVSKSTAS
eukprot:5946564-Amphidinium_carterae.1